ncbi:hypothetical protein F4604DRAFT_1933027 [Suillus subluteus]|nr:hypothetical protein F4604DRAFT_1933027 [Suillus subluteus]
MSSSSAIDALVAALVGLNMSPVTANALVTGGNAVDLDVNQDHNNETAGIPPAPTPVPVAIPPGPSTYPIAVPPTPSTGSPSTITPAPAATAIVNPPLTNANSVGLPPRFMSYQGFPYEIPHASAEGPFYCVTKGKHVGVLATWEDTSPQVMGVRGAIQSRCPSVEMPSALDRRPLWRAQDDFLQNFLDEYFSLRSNRGNDRELSLFFERHLHAVVQALAT